MLVKRFWKRGGVDVLAEAAAVSAATLNAVPDYHRPGPGGKWEAVRPSAAQVLTRLENGRWVETPHAWFRAAREG